MQTRPRLAAIASIAVLPATAADSPCLSEVAKRYPKIYALWGATLPRPLAVTPWMRRLDGVVSPVRAVTVDSQPWHSALSASPKDCGRNMLGLLFSARQDRVKAVATLAGTNDALTVMIGEMDACTMGCIKSLMTNPEAVQCP